MTDAELACAFVADGVRRASGVRWLQGAWAPVMPSRSTSPLVRFVAERRLCKIERGVARGLVAWGDGERPVDLLFEVPSPRQVLALQARGRRCVSLLDAGAPTAPHEDALAFAVHDLCHLEKFVDPEHHIAQRGFFALVHRAMSEPSWAAAFEAGFDDAWAKDRDYVVADMNGSPVFLFAALKMKVKMAVRRRVARARGGEPRCGGALDAVEERAYEEALADLFERLGLRGASVDDAFAVSTRRDSPEAAIRIIQYFEDAGRA